MPILVPEARNFLAVRSMVSLGFLDLLLLFLGIGFNSCNADKLFHKSNPLDAFKVRGEPGSTFVTGALIRSVTLDSAGECARECLDAAPTCVSFAFIPDSSGHPGGIGPVCELYQYSAKYALATGRNATYYLKLIARNDDRIQQQIPWQSSPPEANVRCLNYLN